MARDLAVEPLAGRETETAPVDFTASFGVQVAFQLGYHFGGCLPDERRSVHSPPLTRHGQRTWVTVGKKSSSRNALFSDSNLVDADSTVLSISRVRFTSSPRSWPAAPSSDRFRRRCETWRSRARENECTREWSRRRRLGHVRETRTQRVRAERATAAVRLCR